MRVASEIGCNFSVAEACNSHAESPPRCVAPTRGAMAEPGMQDTDEPLDDPHDDSFAGAPDDPEFQNEVCLAEAGMMRRGQPLAFSVPVPDTPAVESRFLVDWSDAHRETRYPADPSYPNGSAVDVALDATRACRVELPYPASRCGLWVVTCRVCGYAIALSTSGRRDDPRSVRVPCRAG
jgi:hypothetical protein